MRLIILNIFTFFFLLFSHSLGAEEKSPKLLVLIIASDNFPGSNLVFPYKQMQEVWRSYMQLDPTHVKAYFIRSNPDLSNDFELDGDTLWSKTEESVKPGILNKTLLSMEYFLSQQDEFEFDYVLRTNLSSFYVIPKFFDFLHTLPKNRLYCASGEGFGSGCGYLLSSDVVEMIVKHKHEIYDNIGDDDVVMAQFLFKNGIRLLPAPRNDFYSLSDWLTYKQQSNFDHFHFRVKNFIHENRATEDLTIYSELLLMYYGLNKKFI